MKLRCFPYRLQFKHPFAIAAGTRTGTDTVFVEIEHNGATGYGEATLPPYLKETTGSVCDFLSKVDLENYDDPSAIEIILDEVGAIAPGNCAAKAAVDIALHDLCGKSTGKSLAGLFGLENKPLPGSAYTIGIGTPDELRSKLNEAKDFILLKLKLGGRNDRETVETLISETDKPFCADANRGWSDTGHVQEMVHYLGEKGALFIEQPMPVEMIDEMARITEQSPIPTVADESVQRLPDIEKAKGVFSGINIKLMKCTGMREARKMIEKARQFDMKILIGCMGESSCAVTAAAHLSPLCDWVDLDGPYLINNDPFDGMKIRDGKIWLPALPGTGAKPNSRYQTRTGSH